MKLHVSILLSALVALPLPSPAQEEEKIRKLFADAIAELGGDVFLGVTDIVSEGSYFFFDRDGSSSPLVKYSDWTKLPDKSRNEVGNSKKSRDVTVFNLSRNEAWILEGQKDTRAATPDEMKGFRDAVKHAYDNIFRFRWRDPANRLFYLGAGEGSDFQYEVVRILDPENDEVNIYFDRVARLPAKIEYRSTDRQGVRLRHVEEYSQWHVIQGVKTPLRIDTSINGRRSAQQFVLKISYNNNLGDEFFVKPIPPK